MLKYKADLISLIYMISISTLLVVHWRLDHFNWVLYWATILMTPTVFVMVHNHNHLSMWKSRTLNVITDLWQVAFYGYPVFVWVPTHNLNHHKYINKEGDQTITYRFNNRNNILTLLAYPFVSGYYQSALITGYLKKQWNKNSKRFYYCMFQYVFLFFYLFCMFTLDAQKAFLYITIPHLLCLILVLMVNYVQHVHADENSQYNHSRNFTGIENKFMLNNGLHTAHHEKMSAHWSELTNIHRNMESKISNQLLEKSFIWYFLRVYVVSIFVPKFRSKPV